MVCHITVTGGELEQAEIADHHDTLLSTLNGQLQSSVDYELVETGFNNYT